MGECEATGPLSNPQATKSTELVLASSSSSVANPDPLPVCSRDSFIQVPTRSSLPNVTTADVLTSDVPSNLRAPAQSSCINQATSNQRIRTGQNMTCVVETQTNLSPKLSSNVQVSQERNNDKQLQQSATPCVPHVDHQAQTHVSTCESSLAASALTSTPIDATSALVMSSTVANEQHITNFTQAFLEMSSSKCQRPRNGPMSCPPMFSSINSPADSPMQIYSSPTQKISASALNDSSLCVMQQSADQLHTPESGPPPNIPLRHPYYFESPNTLQAMCNRLPNFSMTTPSKAQMKIDSPRRKRHDFSN